MRTSRQPERLPRGSMAQLIGRPGPPAARCAGYRGSNWEWGAGGAMLAVGALRVKPMTAQLMSTPDAP